MPTRDILDSFFRDYDQLTPQQKRQFKAAVRKFVEDVDSGNFRASLDVHPVRGHPGIWEMTWEGDDGRATFQYGPEVQAGRKHVIWRRVGTHAIYEHP